MTATPLACRIGWRLGMGLAAALFTTEAQAGTGVWTTNGPPYPSLSVATDPYVPGLVYTTAARSTDGGETWIPIAVTGTCVAAGPARTVYIGGSSIYKSTDAGASWNGLPVFSGGGYAWYFFTIDPRAPSTVYLSSQFFLNVGHVIVTAYLWKTVDGGLTWNKVFTGTGTEPLITAMAIDPSDSNVLYISSRFANHKSLDGGASWTQLAPLPGLAANLVISAWVVDPLNPETMYVGVGHPTLGGVFKSTDGGSSFFPTVEGLTNTQVSSLVIDRANPSRLYAGTGFPGAPGTGSGVFVSENAGASWEPMVDGLPDLTINSLAIDSSGTLLHAATASGVFDYQTSAACSTAATACLSNGRFLATAAFQAAPSGPFAAATAVALTRDAAYFWFFDPANIELVVKVLAGCGVNGEHWVFASGLTNVGVELEVTDTLSGASKTYLNAFGTPFRPVQDSSAFPCP